MLNNVPLKLLCNGEESSRLRNEDRVVFMRESGWDLECCQAFRFRELKPPLEEAPDICYEGWRSRA